MADRIYVYRSMYDRILDRIKTRIEEDKKDFRDKEVCKSYIVSYINSNYPELILNDVVILPDKKNDAAGAPSGKVFCCIDYTETPTNIVNLLTAEF